MDKLLKKRFVTFKILMYSTIGLKPLIRTKFSQYREHIVSHKNIIFYYFKIFHLRMLRRLCTLKSYFFLTFVFTYNLLVTSTLVYKKHTFLCITTCKQNLQRTESFKGI